MPRESLLRNLKPGKNHLQTIALICGEEERLQLEELTCKAGFVRVTDPRNMNRLYAGVPHDGDYGLRRYTKVIAFV